MVIQIDVCILCLGVGLLRVTLRVMIFAARSLFFLFKLKASAVDGSTRLARYSRSGFVRA